MLGWSGTMGQRIVRLLLEHVEGVQVIGASRHTDPHQLFPTRFINLTDATSFDAALNGIDVLIHAAGPFNHDPTALVHACIERNIHYIDIAESLDFIRNVQRAVASARACSVAIVSGCSTVPGFAACLSQRFSHLDPVARIHVMLNMGSNNPLTQGLCFGLLRPLGGPSTELSTRWFRRLTHTTHLDGQVRHYGNYPIPFEQNMTVGTRSIPVSFDVGFDRLVINYALFMASFLMPMLSDKQLHALCRLAVRCGGALSLIGKTEGRFTLVARDQHDRALESVEVIAAKNGLDIPAITTVWAVEKLLESNGETSGFMGLEALLDSKNLERKLAALPDVRVCASTHDDNRAKWRAEVPG